MAHPGGRPRIYETAEDLEYAIESYFTLCDTRTRIAKKVDTDGNVTEQEVSDPEIYTITGLALHLGYASKQSIYDNEKIEEFSYPIKRARTRIENQIEIEARNVKNPVGQIFMLKNFGWVDKQEIDQTNHYPDGININFVDKVNGE